jgi:hypothetical protein
MMGAGVANLAGAVVSYALAIVASNHQLPEGAPDRLRSISAAIWLTLPLIALVPVASMMPHGPSLILRIAIVAAWLSGVLLLRLVNRYDLEKLESLPLRAAPQRWLRDRAVALGGLLVRNAPPRRVA